MKQKFSLKISPDYDVLYIDGDACSVDAFGDEVSNVEPDLGPCFSIVIPGLEEWLFRYMNATDFVETTTDSSFDWKTWHYEGLCFAKALWEQLPRSYALYYEPPYEDRSQTLSLVEISEDTDILIERLGKEASLEARAPSYKNNVDFRMERRGQDLSALFRINRYECQVDIRHDDLSNIKGWLERIAKREASVESCRLLKAEFFLFRQTVGSHPEMGQFWIRDSYDSPPCFQAYVNVGELVEGLHQSLMPYW